MKFRSTVLVLLAGLQLAHASYPELLNGSEANLEWTATESFADCSLRSPALTFEWTAAAPTVFTMKAPVGAAISGDAAAAMLQRLRTDNPHLSARVAAAMFDACVAEKTNPRPLDVQKQSAIIFGPAAPRGLEAREHPDGCRLKSTYLLNADQVEFSFDITAAASSIRFELARGFAQARPAKLQLDLSPLGGGVASLQDGIEMSLSQEMASALRSDLVTGDTRILQVISARQPPQQIAVGSRVNDSAVAMFSACLKVRGL